MYTKKDQFVATRDKMIKSMPTDQWMRLPLEMCAQGMMLWYPDMADSFYTHDQTWKITSYNPATMDVAVA